MPQEIYSSLFTVGQRESKNQLTEIDRYSVCFVYQRQRWLCWFLKIDARSPYIQGHLLPEWVILA